MASLCYGVAFYLFGTLMAGEPALCGPSFKPPSCESLAKRDPQRVWPARDCCADGGVLYHYLEGSKLNGIIPGPYAVTLFFELSGLLITWLLLKEIETTDRVA